MKPKATSADFPISIDYLPDLSESKQGRDAKYDKMAEIIAAAYKGTKAEKDLESKALLEDAILPWGIWNIWRRAGNWIIRAKFVRIHSQV